MQTLASQDYQHVAGGEWFTLLEESLVDDSAIVAGTTWGLVTLSLAMAANGAFHHRYNARHYAQFTFTSFAYMGALAAGACYAYEQLTG